MSQPPPDRGHMVLYDRMDPPLPAGSYRVEASTEVDLSGASLPTETRYFDIEGPRFRLAPTEVTGVFPPRNGSGPFSDALPHVSLGRRTLPWERTADPQSSLAMPPRGAADPPAPVGPPPWLALLLFDVTDDEEVEIVTDQAVTDVLPPSVRNVLNPPADARCDAILVERSLLRDLMPSLEELHLLSHVRQVNIEDRELSAGDSDGWFSVVVCARVPQANRRYVACLVSVEGRTDLIAAEPPAVAPAGVVGPVLTIDPGPVIHTALPRSRVDGVVAETLAGNQRFLPPRPRLVDKLILLHSWRFECTGIGTFQGLCERLDVGMIGDVRGEWPKVTDTGHTPLEGRDRAGAEETAWYRGPLVPMPLTRDPRGPYHSADQARRVSPETGMEDVTYAAAFEVGRLLAAADARLAQDLMRWRRGDYRRSLQRSLVQELHVRFPDLVEQRYVFELAARLAKEWMKPTIPIIDPLELLSIAHAPGLDPLRLSTAWGIAEMDARTLLAPELAAVGTTVVPELGVDFGAATLGDVLADRPALDALSGLRARLDSPASIGADGYRFEPGEGPGEGGLP
ncbi:MAG: hypothetical protein R3B72_35995 [Polyangiaceae bacterium]